MINWKPIKTAAKKKSFEHKRKTVNERMYELGYNDTKAFREVFSWVTGMLPLRYPERRLKGSISCHAEH